MTEDHIKIVLKLYSGLGKESGIEGYDPQKGITITASQGIKIKKIIRKVKFKNIEEITYFINGEQVNSGEKLYKDCEIVCVKPTAGG